MPKKNERLGDYVPGRVTSFGSGASPFGLNWLQ